jgi:hypothetical protein
MPALEDLAARGVTEVIVDLNLSPRAGVEHAERVLEAFAPRRPRPSA